MTLMILSGIVLALSCTIIIRSVLALKQLANKPRPPLCMHCIPTVRIVQLTCIVSLVIAGMESQYFMAYLEHEVPTEIVKWKVLLIAILYTFNLCLTFSKDVAFGKYSKEECHRGL